VNDSHLAKEADRLSNDPIFNQALQEIRAEALDALAAADADDKTMILRLQQKVAVIDEIRSMLARFILKAGQIEQGDASPYA
jgi:hypothetical protein